MIAIVNLPFPAPPRLSSRRHGHEIVALGNLLPVSDLDRDIDSWMYQTVGHEVLSGYATCMGVPLFRKRIHGTAKVSTPRCESRCSHYLLQTYISSYTNLREIVVSRLICATVFILTTKHVLFSQLNVTNPVP